jgi:hypothetical protein
MTDPIAPLIARATGATRATRSERIAEVWSGYGQVLRYRLQGAEAATVVVKHIAPGRGSGRSHERKLRSYEVEQAFYQGWAERCGEACRVPRCLHAERRGSERLLVFEDLDAAGFPLRQQLPSGRQLETCVRWLAAFHATFLEERPRGLWKVGTYWHLKTRPDELRAMAAGPLRKAAPIIDARLRGARFTTIVHGDAKPENFLFSADGRRAATVDFQYTGGGVGVKDLAYLLAGEDQGTVKHCIEAYFRALRAAMRGGDAQALEDEWRELYPWAWADFERFLRGWAPAWRFQRHELTMTRDVLRGL